MNFKSFLKVSLSVIYVSQASLVHAASFAEVDSDVVFNVGGEDGRNGSNGTSYSGSASGWGSDGRDGGHAGQATPGQNAGNIELNLEKFQGFYTINGVVSFPNGKNQQVQDLKVSLASKGALSLVAKGGGGGAGGNGGDAEDGGTGSRGSDATQYSTGTNGGNGGDGGDAGRGTSGAEAGAGGQVVVKLKEQDTALLMLVETFVNGGKGGQAGRHGRPGSGGSGGSGGSSYSWTTQESYTDTETTSSTDAEGNTTYSTTSVTKYRDQYHSNSGGSSGSSGNSGRSETSSLSDGRNGRDGKYLIRVVEEDGHVREYTQPYDLQLQGYDYIPHDNDGILEPGETVFVKNLKIKNSGGMPTPKNTKVRIFLKNGAYSIAKSVELIIPKSLAAGEEFTFSSENLEFKIKDNMIGKIGEERLVWNDRIRPLAEMTEVNRQFKNFSTDKPIEITYPIEIESVLSNRSLAAGESSKILIKVKNISKKDFGDESELRRLLEIAIKREGGDLTAGQLKITNTKGEPWNIEDGLLKAISKLKAGDSTIIEGVVTASKDAEAYRSLNLSSTLKIGTPDDVKPVTEIQKRNISFRISQTYSVNKDSEFLLVVNNETERASIEEFKKFAQSIGKKVNIWDVSYYGELALTKMLASGSSLADDFSNKTIVVLNNKFKVNQGTSSAQKLVSIKELVLTASQKGVNVLFLGGSAADMAKDIEMQPIDGKGQEIKIETRTFFRKTKERDMLNAAKAKLAELKLEDPNSNYQIIHSYTPELLRKSMFGLFKFWSLGKLEIIKSINANGGQLIALSSVAENGQLTSTELRSREMQLATYMAMPIESRADVLKDLVRAENLGTEKLAQSQLIVESLLLDLAEEQAVARDHFFNFRFGSLAIQKRLPKLVRLMNALDGLSFKAEDKALQRIWIELTVGVKEMAQAKYKWWEKMIPYAANPDYTNEVMRLVNKLESRLIATAPWYRSAKAENQEWTKSELKEIKAEVKAKLGEDVDGLTKISSAAKTSGVISEEQAFKAYSTRKEDRAAVRQQVNELQEKKKVLVTGGMCKDLFK